VAFEPIAAEAGRLMASDPTLTEEAAVCKALEENPRLYEAYDIAKRKSDIARLKDSLGDCPECEANIPTGSKFCPECGEKLK
jgi:hypothetical protein